MVKYAGMTILMTASFIAGTFAPVSQMQGTVQPSVGDYVVMSHMKVPAGGGPEYIALEREIWKAAHQARIQAGKGKSWSLLQARFTGTDAGYSFATVSTYAKLEDIDLPMTEYLQKAHPGKPQDEIQRRTQQAREIVRTQVWRVVDQTK
jgi:hypothetical protein